MRYSIVIIMLLCSFKVFSNSLMEFDVSRTGVVYSSAMKSGSYIVPTAWNSVGEISTTRSWQPGGVLASIDTIEFSSNAGEKVSLPVKVVGIEYNLSNTNFSIAGASTGECSSDSLISMPMVSVIGENCKLATNFNSTSSVKPFSFYRPILSIEEVEVINQLNGLSTNKYRAVIPITFNYFYESATGTPTYRNISSSIVVELNYESQILESVDVIGDGVIVPEYNTVNHTVKGNTLFNITARGSFDSGVRMYLANRKYEMHSSTNNTTIPYSISCEGNCSEKQLVKDSELLISDFTVTVDKPSNVISFDLKVSYEDISADQLESATYNDSFTMMFELEL